MAHLTKAYHRPHQIRLPSSDGISHNRFFSTFNGQLKGVARGGYATTGVFPSCHLGASLFWGRSVILFWIQVHQFPLDNMPRIAQFFPLPFMKQILLRECIQCGFQRSNLCSHRSTLCIQLILSSSDECAVLPVRHFQLVHRIIKLGLALAFSGGGISPLSPSTFLPS